MNVAQWIEVLSLCGTLLLAYPPIRISFKLRSMRWVGNQVAREGVPEALREMEAHWRRVGHTLLQSWSPVDHACLCGGLAALVVASMLRLAIAG